MDKRNIDNLNQEDRFFDIARIEIDGMTDDACVQKVESTLRSVPGVREVRVDRNANLALVRFDTRQTHVPALHDALMQSGYQPAPFAEPSRR